MLLRSSFLVASIGLASATACIADETIDPRADEEEVSPIFNAPGLALDGLSERWAAEFNRGDAIFELPFREGAGLGPLFIRQSCASCHVDDVRGPGMVQKMVQVEADGITPSEDQSLFPFGHTIRPFANRGAAPLLAPPESANVKVTTRIGPPVIGRGMMEAIRDDEIERVAREQASRSDGISGRIHYVTWTSQQNPDTTFGTHYEGEQGLIGRFGLKARIATIDDFTADAFQGDMGLTNPLRPTELPNAEGIEDDAITGIDIPLEELNAVANYVRLLGVPPRKKATRAATELFASVQCAACHVPSMRTRDDYPVEVLRGIDAPVYTDMLLHDMGELLADALVEGDASGSEWRTAPLVGLRFNRVYMHDGRARDVEAAILAHEGPGSEANGSVAAFRALSAEDRRKLIELVESL